MVFSFTCIRDLIYCAKSLSLGIGSQNFGVTTFPSGKGGSNLEVQHHLIISKHPSTRDQFQRDYARSDENRKPIVFGARAHLVVNQLSNLGYRRASLMRASSEVKRHCAGFVRWFRARAQASISVLTKPWSGILRLRHWRDNTARYLRHCRLLQNLRLWVYFEICFDIRFVA